MVNNINTGCGIPSGGTPRPQRYSFCAPVVLVFVYTCVYSCVPTCTLLYTRVYTEAIITTSFRGSLLLYGWASLCVVDGSPLLYEWALLGSPEGLVSARRMDTSQLCKWARATTMDSLFSSPWQAFLCSFPIPL